MAAVNVDVIDLPEGYVAFGREGKNEVDLVSTTPSPGDPPKTRQGAMFGRGKGIWSINHVRPDGRHEEIGFVIGKLDERYPEAALIGAIEVHLRRPDGEMAKVLALEHDRVICYQPLIQTAGGDAFAEAVIALYRDLLGRTPSGPEIDSHRGNPGGVDGVREAILASPEYQGR